MNQRQQKNNSPYHWLIVACCSGMMISTLGISINSSGVFYMPVAKELGVGRGDVAMYITIMNLVTGLFGAVVIRCSEKLTVRTMVGIGGLLTTLSLAAWSFVTGVWQLYLIASFHGIGNAMFGNVIVNMLIGNWFRKNRGLAMGIAFSFSGISGAVFSPVFQNIIETAGWRTAHMIAAAISFLSVLPSVIFIRLRPEEKGYMPYGYSGESTVADSKKFKYEPEGVHITRIQNSYIMIVCIVGFISAFLTGMGQHMSGYATSIGLTASAGAFLISATMIGNMSSKLILGILCDRIGTARAFLLFVVLSMSGFAILSIFAGSGFEILSFAAFLVGCSFSLSGLGMSQVTSSIFGPYRFSSVYAYATTATLVGSSFSSSLIGYSFDIFGTYTISAIFCTSLSLVAILLLIWMFKSSGIFSLVSNTTHM